MLRVGVGHILIVSLCQCLGFLLLSENTVIKNNLGRNAFISPYSLQPIMKRVRAGTQVGVMQGP